jgi:hypothetical protein
MSRPHLSVAQHLRNMGRYEELSDEDRNATTPGPNELPAWGPPATSPSPPPPAPARSDTVINKIKSRLSKSSRGGLNAAYQAGEATPADAPPMPSTGVLKKVRSRLSRRSNGGLNAAYKVGETTPAGAPPMPTPNGVKKKKSRA